ncbi:hypothetical protein EVAR_38366_1 [Eumeta japonica]|uniref:Uncharacterized protein n=1 Tax=Eumeta variegata TaxID=151549 RepID=A0A4C1XWD0_EUMVA|nr:hypothetical protein EVAR_38366_1 [Eumeta japonica]
MDIQLKKFRRTMERRRRRVPRPRAITIANDLARTLDRATSAALRARTQQKYMERSLPTAEARMRSDVLSRSITRLAPLRQLLRECRYERDADKGSGCGIGNSTAWFIFYRRFFFNFTSKGSDFEPLTLTYRGSTVANDRRYERDDKNRGRRLDVVLDAPSSLSSPADGIQTRYRFSINEPSSFIQERKRINASRRVAYDVAENKNPNVTRLRLPEDVID